MVPASPSSTVVREYQRLATRGAVARAFFSPGLEDVVIAVRGASLVVAKKYSLVASLPTFQRKWLALFMEASIFTSVVIVAELALLRVLDGHCTQVADVELLAPPLKRSESPLH